MSRQQTLSCFGFENQNSNKAIKATIKEKIVKKSQQQMAIYKDTFPYNGKLMNQFGTTEHALEIDGSPNEYFQKAKRIIMWSKTHPTFDISVTMGILANAEFNRNFSSNQRISIDNTYYKCYVFAKF